jgi:hypothetical protein
VSLKFPLKASELSAKPFDCVICLWAVVDLFYLHKDGSDVTMNLKVEDGLSETC